MTPTGYLRRPCIDKIDLEVDNSETEEKPIVVLEYRALATGANIMRQILGSARQADQYATTALMGYSEAIEHGIHALLNETRDIFVVANRMLGDDKAVKELQLRIDRYFYVQEIYEPLRNSCIEVEATLDRLEQKVDRSFGAGDIARAKKSSIKDSIEEYRSEFKKVLGFTRKLEQNSMHLPRKTGLLKDELEKLMAVLSLDRDERLAHHGEVKCLVDQALAKLADADLTEISEKLVAKRHRIVGAFD